MRPALPMRGVGMRTVRGRRCVSQVPLLLLLAAAGSSCATQSVEQTLTLEQHSLRIPLTLAADGTVMLAERPPLVGRIDLSPILKAEGVLPGARAKAPTPFAPSGRSPRGPGRPWRPTGRFPWFRTPVRTR